MYHYSQLKKKLLDLLKAYEPTNVYKRQGRATGWRGLDRDDSLDWGAKA